MIRDIINRLRADATTMFSAADRWFDTEGQLLNYRPSNGGWSIAQVLEHIWLTNHYLLILVKKGTANAVRKARRMQFAGDAGYIMNWDALKAIGEHRSFEWNRPAHMEPAGIADLNEIRMKLNGQLQELLHCLHQMPAGEGSLHRTMMSVHGLGKIDVYHYIYFLVQHVKRHLVQMDKIRTEFESI